MAAFVGAFLAGPVSDNFGRKKTLFMSITAVSIASIPISFLPNWQLLLGIFRNSPGHSDVGDLMLVTKNMSVICDVGD